MELVYLWVEKYKNIKRQGFNFSPRFSCDFDVNSNILEIADKEKTKEPYMKDFFGENINVTAIVGENGAGKSTVIEFLIELFSKKLLEDVSIGSFLFLYVYENQLQYFSNEVYPSNLDELKNNGLKVQENELLDDGYNESAHENLISLYINNEYSDIESRGSTQFFVENSKKSMREINNLIIENSLKLKDKVKIENYFIPTTINIKLKEIDYFTSILDKDREFYKDEVWNKISVLKKQLKDTTLISKIDLIKKIFKIKREEYNTIMGEAFFSFGQIKDKGYFNWEYKDFCENIPRVIKNIATKEKEHLLNISDVDAELLDFLYELPKEFDIELEDEKRKFSKLSFGERQLLIIMNNVLKYLLLEEYFTIHHDQDGEEHENKHNINEIVLFIDEFEIGLHPNWQKKFFSYFSEITKFTKKKIHLIMTSHSPFLLSDIPKENVIFLAEGKQVYPFENRQTFGANIHTLLSHGFFMKDGLMGEFAKDKIDRAIKYLNQTKLSEKELEYCENIILIIGEPIIKRQLQKMLDSKRLKKIDEIDKIYDEIEFLKHRVESLRKNQ